jgi:hypothetical protein
MTSNKGAISKNVLVAQFAIMCNMAGTHYEIVITYHLHNQK